MSERSDNEKKLRDLDAAHYDDWYLERGQNAVLAEDNTVIHYLDFSTTIPQKFLDLGCGTGRLTEKIARQFPNLELYGLDLSGSSIDLVKQKGFKINAYELDISNTPLASLNLPSFDRILSMQMIQHLEDDGAVHAINEMYTALAPKGIAVIELYNYGGLNRLVERIRARGGIKKIQTEKLFYEHRYTANEFKQFVTANSEFKNIKLYGCQNIHRKLINKFDWLVNLDTQLSRMQLSRYLGYYFIAVMQKPYKS